MDGNTREKIEAKIEALEEELEYWRNILEDDGVEDSGVVENSEEEEGETVPEEEGENDEEDDGEVSE